jgi:glycosyltransferase involved in cell wall biosynthesis
MKLSIVIPAYNEEAYIEACLQAILAEVARSQCEVEVIVVNNASTDRTGDKARAFPGVRVIDEPRKGLVRARQAGFEASRGELVGSVDADTRMPSGWIETVLHEFEVDPKLVGLTGPCVYYDLSPWANFLVWTCYKIGVFMNAIYSLVTGKSGTMFQGGNSVVKRSTLQAVGGFDLSFEFYGEDSATALKINQMGRIKFTPLLTMPVSGRRLQGEGLIIMACKYFVNFIWTTLFGRPYSREYRDIR